LGGNSSYTAVGLAIWETGIGLIGRVGSDFPSSWIQSLSKKGFDCRGIRIMQEPIDLRSFYTYEDYDQCQTDNPVTHFAKLGLPMPKELLGYARNELPRENKLKPSILTMRMNDIPDDYLDATSIHLGPMDYLSHHLLPSILQQGHINTVTLSPAASYMQPIFWDEVHKLVKGLTAFIVPELKLRTLYQGRSTEFWEMVEDIGACGCEIVIIKHGSNGQSIYDSGSRKKWHIPNYPIEARNPVGADDAFCGGFQAGYHLSYNPLEAALYGIISTSMVVEGNQVFYALDSLPGLARARLDNLRQQIKSI